MLNAVGAETAYDPTEATFTRSKVCLAAKLRSRLAKLLPKLVWLPLLLEKVVRRV